MVAVTSPRRVTIPSLVPLFPVLFFTVDHNMQADEFDVYVGTYTGGKSEGIYRFKLNSATGECSHPELAATSVSPAFLAIHPAHRYLYAVNAIETYQGEKTGSVSAFSIDEKTGDLTLLNRRPSVGAGPCHLVVDQTGKNVLVANYAAGSVASLPIGDNGQLGDATASIQHVGSGVNPERQEGPHAHSINLDSANRFAFVADLGLDKVLVYRFDADQGTLTVNDPAFVSVKPGAGPRHFAFHPDGDFAYVINEMDLTVTAFAYDARRGELTTIQTISTIPQGVTGDDLSTAEVRVHPSGKFLYGSNRGHDSIAMFKIDQKTGKLTHFGNQPTQGETPRNFAIDPTGSLLLAENQTSDTIVVFRIDPEEGTLEATGTVVSVPTPVCVRMIPLSPANNRSANP